MPSPTRRLGADVSLDLVADAPVPQLEPVPGRCGLWDDAAGFDTVVDPRARWTLWDSVCSWAYDERCWSCECTSVMRSTTSKGPTQGCATMRPKLERNTYRRIHYIPLHKDACMGAWVCGGRTVMQILTGYASRRPRPFCGRELSWSRPR